VRHILTPPFTAAPPAADCSAFLLTPCYLSPSGIEDMCSEFIPGDICDKHAVATAMANIDVLIHLAAFPDITDAEGKMVDFIDTLLMPNVAGLYICVEAALQAVTPHDPTQLPAAFFPAGG